MNVEKEFLEFRNLTIELIDRVNIEGNRLYILEKRDNILHRIMSSNCSIEEIREVALKLNIYNLEKELHNRIKKEMNDIQSQIYFLNKSKQGNQAYIKAGYSRYVQSKFDKKY